MRYGITSSSRKTGSYRTRRRGDVGMMNCFTTDYGWKLLGGKGGGKGSEVPVYI